MRLRSVWISQYKNLRDFTIGFEGDGFIDIFVGKNGSGKSNFLEALIEIFDHVYSARPGEAGPRFDYELNYEIEHKRTKLRWRDGRFDINEEEGRRTLGQTPAPDHLLVYYSGQNGQVAELVRRYEEKFRDELRRAVAPIAPKIISIGPSCKKLLVVTMLMLPEDYLARQILCAKLGILNCRRSIEIILSKPHFVDQVEHDPFDDEQIFWGVTGYVRTFLEHLVGSIEGEFTPGQLYDREAGRYHLTFSIDRLRIALGDESGLALYRSLDALRVLGMLADIRLPLALQNLEVSGLDLFSDGQIQSVYLFGIAELFKGLNCVGLMDEPDAFLHPEWQFEILQQVNAISDQAASTNHFLLTSHSASTIAAEAPVLIRLFSSEAEGITVQHPEKSDLIHSLSAGLITFSEQEATLSIHQIIESTDGPVLFTEGPSDAEILRHAWDVLHPEEKAPFAIEAGYGKNFIRNLLTNPQIYAAHPGRAFFALFDFDDAYAEWQNFKITIETDPANCLAGRWGDKPGFGLLLPVPMGSSIVGQVLKADGSGHYKERSRLSIELMFRDVAGLEQHFEEDPDERDGCIRFKGEKMRFAKVVVPTLDARHFACFQPIFDFVAAHSKAAEMAVDDCR